MPYVWGILSFLFWIIGFVMFLGLINPNWINKRLKENQKPFTRKKALLSWVVFSFLFIVFAAIAVPKSTTNAQEPLTNAPVSTIKPTASPKVTEVPKVASTPKATEATKTSESPSPSPIQTKAPTATPIATVASKTTDDLSPKFKGNVQGITSMGGVGDTFFQARVKFGEPTRINIKMSEGYGQYNFQNDLEVVTFVEGRINSISYQLDVFKKQTSMSKALILAKASLPSDITPVKEYDKDTQEHIVVFHSKSIEDLFSSKWFEDRDGNVQKGIVSVDLVHTGDECDSYSVNVSDNY